MRALPKTLIALAAMVAVLTVASAQDQKDKEATVLYEEAGGWDIPLYRGKQMPEYNYRFNGTYFWDNTGFRRGDICYGGKMYYNVLMNIDAYRKALYVRYQDKVQTWELDRDLIDWFTIMDWLTGQPVKYVNLKGRGVKKAPEGFMEVIHEGEDCIFRQVVKSYRESVEISGYNRIGYEDRNYNENVFVFFDYKETFYFLGRDGKLEKFSSQRFLLNKYPKLKKALRMQIKNNNWGDMPLKIWCKNIMNYVESAK